MKSRVPSVSEVSFNCPHCGALAKQDWHDVYSRACEVLPQILSNLAVELEKISRLEGENGGQEYTTWRDYVARCCSGEVFLEESTSSVKVQNVTNISLSKCFACNAISIWIHEKLIWPEYSNVPLPNSDMPTEIKREYLEAASILQKSPRGACALLRLAIQKICLHLGLPGTDLNHDIGELVKQGLDKKIQQALDVVRVVGNESVHPGEMDLRDNVDLASKMFVLVNRIIDDRITHPREHDELFSILPNSKKLGVNNRDKK